MFGFVLVCESTFFGTTKNNNKIKNKLLIHIRNLYLYIYWIGDQLYMYICI